MNNPDRLKKCKICNEMFKPLRFAQIACSVQCAIEHSKALKAKKDRKEHKEAKLKLKSRSDWLREVQAVFNRFIRLRDDKLPCISCQRHHAGQYHAGHYKTVGAAPELRFNELNVHKQCAPCNNHLSGNILNYRQNLIKKIGLEKVEWLESKHEPVKYTIDDLIELKKLYQNKIKDKTK